jgi:ketosteroid isomerase-like protein
MGDTTSPAGVIEAFGRRLGAGDVEGALALYEDDAVFQAAPAGPLLRGHAEIRDALHGFAALRPTLESTIVKVHETGGVALVANRWTLRGIHPDGSSVETGGTSADVLRRRDDGTWGILVDDPWGVSEPERG